MSDQPIVNARFCKDCRWCEPLHRPRLLGFLKPNYESAQCTRPPEYLKEDQLPKWLVDGEHRISCWINRKYHCGTDGRHFEPRDPTRRALWALADRLPRKDQP